LKEENHHGLDADGTEETHRYYAEALYFAGEYDLARAQFQSIVVWAERKFGPEHLKTLERRMSWGYALEACRLSSPAREQFKLAASGFERASNGVDTLDSLRCRYKHGMLASAHEAYDRNWPHWPEAEESLRRAAQGFTRLSKPEDDEAFAAQIGYATVLLKMCKDQDALSQFRRSLQIARQKHMPPDHPTIQKIQCNIKECEFWLSKPLATRSADRLHTARTRAAQQQQQKDWRSITGHW
jgi:tetratricopeptide (TPR) repeat protein